jgi:CheY-like chemotaxis protein
MTPEEPVTVVVADDQSAVREGLVLLLGTLPGITVAGEAADGDAAVQLVATVQRASPPSTPALASSSSPPTPTTNRSSARCKRARSAT